MAVDAGADAVGFVFYEKSPRCVTVETAREICEKLPESVEKVGVFVDADCDDMKKVTREAELNIVQLHGDRSREGFFQETRPAIDCVGVSKVIAVIPESSLREADSGIKIRQGVKERTSALMIDSQVNGCAGGTGTTFDWEATQAMVMALSLSFPMIVAGGLNPANVARALKIFQPWGVDVVSGVEASPGKKDPEKVRAFVRAVRECDGKVG